MSGSINNFGSVVDKMQMQLFESSDQLPGRLHCVIVYGATYAWRVMEAS
jgi:hypothetical protein